MLRRVVNHGPLLLVLFALALLAPGAAVAQTSRGDADGALTVHDEPDGPEAIDVADCTIFVRGHGVALASGTVDVYESRGRAGVSLLTSVAFEGEPSKEHGYEFLTGPIEIDIGDRPFGMRLYIEVAIEGARGEFTDPERYIWTVTTVHCGRPYIPCVEGIVATVLDGGAVRLEWEANPNATRGYLVERYDGTDLPNGQPFSENFGLVSGTSFVDDTAEPGARYYYEVHGASETDFSNRRCPGVEVTAVPFFGAPLLGALAVAGGLGAYAFARRR